MIQFTSESTMEFDTLEDLKTVIDLMPWTPEQKEEFFNTGSMEEEEEAEFDSIGSVDSKHKFSFKEV